MAKSSIYLLDSFDKKLKGLERTRKKQEGLFSNGQLVLRDIEEVYAAIFLNSVVSFEVMIEELFIGLLAGKVNSRFSNVNSRVKITSHIVAREVVLQGRKFFDWLPYDRTITIANVFFTGGRPFTIITKVDEKHIDKCITIRHAIAHQSQHAISKFKNEVLKGLSLIPRDRRPKSFLRAQFSATPPINYYQQLVGDLHKIARKLC